MMVSIFLAWKVVRLVPPVESLFGYLFLTVTQGLGVSGIPCTVSSLSMLRKGAQHCDRCGEVPPVAFPTHLFGAQCGLSLGLPSI